MLSLVGGYNPHLIVVSNLPSPYSEGARDRRKVGVMNIDKLVPYVMDSDAFLAEATAPEMVVDDLMMLESINLITGAPGVGKTFFADRKSVV